MKKLTGDIIAVKLNLEKEKTKEIRDMLGSWGGHCVHWLGKYPLTMGHLTSDVNEETTEAGTHLKCLRSSLVASMAEQRRLWSNTYERFESYKVPDTDFRFYVEIDSLRTFLSRE